VFTACLTSFTHGANDVANAVGPLAAIMQIQKGGYNKKSGVEIWILAMVVVVLVLVSSFWDAES